MVDRSCGHDLLDLVELNELKTGEESKFFEFLAAIDISPTDIEKYHPHDGMPDALNRLITAFNLGICTGQAVKDCLIFIGLNHQQFEIPSDYSPARAVAGKNLLDQLDLIVLIIAVSKVKALTLPC